MVRSREVRLRRRPVGAPVLDDFELVATDVGDLQDGEVLVRNRWMSVDPYMRFRMMEAPAYTPYRGRGAYAGPANPIAALGEPLAGEAIGEVVDSQAPGFAAGDMVISHLGWREAGVTTGAMLRRLDARGLPPQAFLGVLGLPGMTAYVGLLRVAALREGDVVFVSGAAGAVGQVACQIAQLKGARVVASAGGAEKVAFLQSLGVDAAIDYKAEPDLEAALMQAAPNGIDVYFDNVGGEHLDVALLAARPNARFALCGAISQYNRTDGGHGVRNLMLAVGKQIRLEGFINTSHADLAPAFLREMSQWVASGDVVWRETVERGIDNAPAAFLRLFSGENLGKMLVKLD